MTDVARPASDSTVARYPGIIDSGDPEHTTDGWR
jgi:hypothetical protein